MNSSAIDEQRSIGKRVRYKSDLENSSRENGKIEDCMLSRTTFYTYSEEKTVKNSKKTIKLWK